ncbi:hypothetical protein CBA19CS22_36835 [Caballeronia novacaledonica]|uniref:Uncharacterized protein n=1 Tax=Caballeronia novacaledonica TaxID=1544861 RepID=A0ACB5R4X7_9BURK|nr:hypothetical protein CBA19CS22_36835 [Caballeronia novacaledonica]
MSLPVVAWITPGVRRQLEAFAQSQNITTELCAGEAITAYLRAQGAPPADPVPVDIERAQWRSIPEAEKQRLRVLYADPESTPNRIARRRAQMKGEKP